MTTRGGRPRKEAGEPADRFAALADPTRRHLLERLAEREHAVNELVQSLELSQAAVSQHLRVLREAGLVTVRAEGRHRRYGLDPAGFEPLRDWLDELERFWRARLRTLGDYLDRPGGAMNGSEGER